MPAQTNTNKAAEAREAGNVAYKKGKWVDAIGHYTTATVLAPQDPAPLLNRAQAYLKIQKWQDCERDCTKVLGLAGQGGNVKALYRRALARKECKLFDEARRDLETLLKAEPTNAAAKEELAELKKAIKSAQKASAPKKAPQDISTFAELTSKRTSASAKSLPTRDRTSSAVNVPIKIVPRFTTRPTSLAQATADGQTFKSAELSKEAESSTSTSATPSSAFAASKATRSAKSSYNNVEAPASVSRSDHSKHVEDGPVRPAVRSPSTGLELVDRLEALAGDDNHRWQLLESVPPSRLPTLLGGILEPDHLATIYATLSARHAQTVKDDGLVREYMQALRRIPRWQMTESLLLPDERKMGKALWNALEL